MRLTMLLRVSMKALRRNMMRTALTMLGVIIGVSAVICVIAIGEGASSRIREAISSIGANVIWVEAGGVNKGGVRTGTGGTKSLTLADMRAIKDQIAPGPHISPLADLRAQLLYGNHNSKPQPPRTLPDYPNFTPCPLL